VGEIFFGYFFCDYNRTAIAEGIGSGNQGKFNISKKEGSVKLTRSEKVSLVSYLTFMPREK